MAQTLLSNTLEFDRPLVHQGIEYRTVENFYQAMKTQKDDLEMRRKIDAMFPPDAQYAPLEVLVGRSVDMLVLHAAEHKQFHELMESGWVSPEMRALTMTMNEEIERKIGEILAHRTPQMQARERRLVSVVMMNLVKAVLPAIDGFGEPERSAIIEEFKRLGVYYMQSEIS